MRNKSKQLQDSLRMMRNELPIFYVHNHSKVDLARYVFPYFPHITLSATNFDILLNFAYKTEKNIADGWVSKSEIWDIIHLRDRLKGDIIPDFSFTYAQTKIISQHTHLIRKAIQEQHDCGPIIQTVDPFGLRLIPLYKCSWKKLYRTDMFRTEPMNPERYERIHKRIF